MAAAVTTALEVVGRDAELTAIRGFLTEPPPRTLVIEGEAGIGKTTLWQYALACAAEAGSQALVARPTRAEAQLSLGGLADLVADVPPEAASALPEIQQHALAVVRAEEGPSTEGIDGHVVAAAFLSLLRALSAERPVALAVDDIQWLDESSAAAIVFAMRRLRSEDVRLLVSCRGTPGAVLPYELERLDGARLLRLSVGPLSEGALHRLLHRRLGLSLSRPLLHAVHETSGGNPFFALELGRAGIELRDDGSIELPRSLDSLVHARLARLPVATQRALAYVAALSEPTLSVLARCDDVAAALEPACAAGVLTLERGRLRFDHPLLGAAAWSAAEPAQRRAVHRTLAEATDDPEERARHLALATQAPNASVAGALEHAATRARARGATAAAVDLFEQARRLTPPDDGERWARVTVAAIVALREVGDWERPMLLVQEALERLPTGSARASVLIAAAEIRAGALDLCRQALAEAEDDKTRVRALLGVAEQLEWLCEWKQMLAAAREALVLARRLDDPLLLSASLTAVGAARFHSGDPGAGEELTAALEIEQQLGLEPLNQCFAPATWVPAWRALCTDEVEDARAMFERELPKLADRGDEASYLYLAINVVALETDTGRFQRARQVADECVRLEAASDECHSWVSHTVAGLAACEGGLTEARASFERALELYQDVGDRFGQSQCHAHLTFIELCDGNPEAALEHAAARHATVGENLECAKHPRFEMDELEALVLTGRLRQAETLIERLREVAARQSRPRYLASAGWGEGLLRAARGDLTGAQAALEAALAAHEQLQYPFDCARIRLSYGQVLRRSKQRKAARDVLNETLAEFERLGARHFAAKTREELARVGGRPPVAEGALTPTEEKVARLVAQGLSNKEVAAQLFVTVRTVEANLTRVYAKLGVRSRLQLSRALEVPAP